MEQKSRVYDWVTGFFLIILMLFDFYFLSELFNNSFDTIVYSILFIGLLFIGVPTFIFSLQSDHSKLYIVILFVLALIPVVILFANLY